MSSYADRFQIGSDMPAGGFQTLTGTVRPRSIVADNQVGKKVDNALKSEAITNAMAASLSANAAAARDHAEIVGTQQPLANQFLSDQPLLPAYPGPGSTGLVPDTRAQAVDPDPTLPANASPSAKAIYFSGVEAHPVIMEAFVAVVWPKTRLGSEWQYKVGTLQPSAGPQAGGSLLRSHQLLPRRQREPLRGDRAEGRVRGPAVRGHLGGDRLAAPGRPP